MGIDESRMTLSELARALDLLDGGGRQRLIDTTAKAGVGGQRWDEAWERVLAAGSATAGVEFAARWGSWLPVTAQAALAGAAAALIAGTALEQDHVEALLLPLRGSLLPPPAPGATPKPGEGRRVRCPFGRGAALSGLAR